MLYGLDTHEWETVLAAIAQRPEVTEVKLIGSRAMNTYRPNSDVDLVLYGEGVNLKTLGAISGELDESTLPYKFDLIAFNKVKEAAFLEHIQRYGKRIYPGVRMDRKETEVGIIPEHWDVRPLGELTTKIGSGATPRGGEEAYKAEGIARLLG